MIKKAYFFILFEEELIRSREFDCKAFLYR
jgi:hypothetical protein